MWAIPCGAYYDHNNLFIDQEATYELCSYGGKQQDGQGAPVKNYLISAVFQVDILVE